MKTKKSTRRKAIPMHPNKAEVKLTFWPVRNIFHAMESYHISACGLCPHKEHDVMASAIVRATLPLCEPIWDQGSSRRLKASAKEPSLCGHNRSSCKAFGKSVTTKEHSGLIQEPALCPRPPTPMGRWRRGRPWKEKEYVWVVN